MKNKRWIIILVGFLGLHMAGSTQAVSDVTDPATTEPKNTSRVMDKLEEIEEWIIKIGVFVMDVSPDQEFEIYVL